MILDSSVEVTGVTTNVTLHAGHDVAYFTRGQDAGGCAGAMSYYTAAGEPPGQWAGTAARKSLGLTGQVDAGVLDRLFMKGIGPDGEILAAKRQRKDAAEREEAAVAAYRAAHPYASAVEIAEVRAAERGKDPHTVPYFDLTVSAVKSVSVLHASYRTAARQARDRGDEEEAAALDAKAQEIEDALTESAREAVGWLEAHATYTRTGHHSATTGEWRDGDGLAAALFLHHISRDGDPQLHVHVAIWNRVQRGDKADDKWRTLDSRTLHNQRLARRRHHRPADGDKADRAGLCDGAPPRRQRRRGRRRRPGRDRPVQLPRRRDHRGTQAAGRRVRSQPRHPAEPAHAVAAAPAGRAEHPPQQERRRAAPSPGRPAAPNPPTPSGSPRGKPRPPAGKSRRCRRYTRR